MDDSGFQHNTSRNKIPRSAAIGIVLLRKRYIQAWFTWIGWCVASGALVAASIYLKETLSIVSGIAAFISLLFVYLSALAAFQRLVLSKPKTRLGRLTVFLVAFLFGRTGPILIGVLIIAIVFEGVKSHI